MKAALQLLVAILSASEPQGTDADGPGARFESGKSLPVLEKCLTERLSEVGEVTAIKIEGTKSLVLQAKGERPMVIDLAPPAVVVMTKFVFGTRKLVESCL